MIFQKSILIILHQGHSTPGRVGLKLQQKGYALDIRKPRFGDKMPTTLENHAGAVIFGGPMSANDNEEWLKQEIDWIAIPLKENRPFLGICLGAQMLTKTIGGEVVSCPDSTVEAGYYPIFPTELCQNELPSWPSHVYQWHRDWMRVPDPQSRLLAKGVYDSHQAFKASQNAFGIQFHPEVTRKMMHRWTVLAAPFLEQKGAHPASMHIQNRHQYDPQVDAWLEQFLDHWLSSEKS